MHLLKYVTRNRRTRIQYPERGFELVLKQRRIRGNEPSKRHASVKSEERNCFKSCIDHMNLSPSQNDHFKNKHYRLLEGRKEFRWLLFYASMISPSSEKMDSRSDYPKNSQTSPFLTTAKSWTPNSYQSSYRYKYSSPLHSH